MKARVLTLAAIALCCHAAEPDKTVLVLGARAGDAERIGAAARRHTAPAGTGS